MLAILVMSLLQVSSAEAYDYPPPPLDENILRSPINPNVTISYRQPEAGTCQTAFKTQKQYSGYIELPPATIAPIQQNYSMNTFFWFIEARQTPETAPLTIWLNGGPGTSSMFGLFAEMGPCKVVQVDDGSYGTQNSMWGWDRSSNLLFIDQPNQVGFSYDQLVNGSYDFLAGQIYEPPTPPSTTLPSFMYRNGTFSTANTNDRVPWAHTANTTEIAAHAVWHFLQTWLTTFPQYNPATRPNETLSSASPIVGINLFTESYGGKFGPAFATFFEEQNQHRANGAIPRNITVDIQLENVGIINGLVDDAVQYPFYPQFAYNNTYNLQTIDYTTYLNLLQTTLSGSDGCLVQIGQCRAAMAATDAEGYGDVVATNQLCSKAQDACEQIHTPLYAAGYSPYDIRRKLPSPDPPAAYQEYLNNASVLQAIGAKVNYTESSSYVQSGFISTGDTIRGGYIQDLADLLRRGVRVALIYGDADYLCNWYGGQAVSLAIAAELASYPIGGGLLPYGSAFPAAGYAEVVINSSYVGGSVRQYGNLSFSRIYDAGHFVPYFQPETAFTVFTRIIQGNDIATGEVTDLTAYNSSGPVNATHTNTIPSSTPLPTCWVRSWNESCSQQDLAALMSGKGNLVNGIFYRDANSADTPHSSITAASPGRPVYPSNATVMGDQTTSMALTGVYTATSTPSHSQGRAIPTPGMMGVYPLAITVGAMVLGMIIMA